MRREPHRPRKNLIHNLFTEPIEFSGLRFLYFPEGYLSFIEDEGDDLACVLDDFSKITA
jgi:hypothetical protein